MPNKTTKLRAKIDHLEYKLATIRRDGVPAAETRVINDSTSRADATLAL
jgi:hypothetical protein